MDHVNVVGFGAAMSFLDSCLAAHGIFPKVLQTYFDIPMLILLAFVPSLRNMCMYINGFAKLICKIRCHVFRKWHYGFLYLWTDAGKDSETYLEHSL